MNRYFAICHSLSLLEQPISLADFIQQVNQSANPLFGSACSMPQQVLDCLKEEQIVQESVADSERYQLTSLGESLYQHLLQWTARDKQSLAQQREQLKAAGQDQSVDVHCPRCGSDFCGLYLFVVMIERMYVGMPEWTHWQPEELNVMIAALNQYFEALQQPIQDESSSKSLRLILLEQSRSLNQLLPGERKALSSQLTRFGRRKAFQQIANELKTAFRQGTVARRLIPELPALTVPHVRLSRLRFEYGLMAPGQWQALRQLAYPRVFTQSSESALSQTVQNHLVLLSCPALEARQEHALVLLHDNGQDILFYLRKTLAWEIQARFECE